PAPDCFPEWQASQPARLRRRPCRMRRPCPPWSRCLAGSCAGWAMEGKHPTWCDEAVPVAALHPWGTEVLFLPCFPPWQFFLPGCTSVYGGCLWRPEVAKQEVTGNVGSNRYYGEALMPGPETRPLFEAAVDLGIGFYLGYAELVEEGERPRRFNTSIIVDKAGKIVGKYRKIHLPGHHEHEPRRAFQHLEKRYFEPGDLGFGVWRAFGGIVGVALCNDRRWPETYRVLGLKGVELMMLGYNTPLHYPPVPEHDHLQAFHNHIVMQAGAYQNGTWIVAVAKAGREEGCDLLGQSCI